MFQAEYDIRFRHPAYEDPYDIFIVLPGLDHPEGGIHHQTALLACAFQESISSLFSLTPNLMG
jgi:hypothetical protein